MASLRVLTIEDDAAIRRGIVDALSFAGYEVIQAEDGAAGSAPGVGLGLALSRRLARQLGGDLICERSDKQCTTFALTLPVSTASC